MYERSTPKDSRPDARASVWLICAVLLTVSAAHAQPTRVESGSDGPAPSSMEFSDGDLDQLYRDLYGVQVRIGEARGRESEVDSLRRERDVLLEEIRRIAREIETRETGLSARENDEISNDLERRFDTFVRDLEDAAVEEDWKRLSEVIGEQAETWGQGLEMIGRELEGLEVDIEENRVRIGTGSGSRFTFSIPPEVREEMQRGLREIGVEMSRVLDDSAGGRWGAELEGLLEDLPDEMGGHLFAKRRSREKTVIAGSIFRTREDVEVGPDELVRGDVYLIGADAYIEGEVDGNVYVAFGDVFVEGDGEVAGDAFSVGGRVSVDGDSRVHGRRYDFAAFGPGVVPGGWSQTGAVAWVVHWSRVAVLALFVVVAFQLLAPRMRVLAEHGERNAPRDLAAGTLWLPVTLGVSVIASVGLAISVIGIPVVLVLLLVLGAVAVCAYAVGSHTLGHFLLERFGAEGARPPWQAALIGLAVVEVPALAAMAVASADGVGAAEVVLRVLDFLARFAVLAVGTGAIVATRGGMEQPTPDDGGAAESPLAIGAASDAGTRG